jgi:hypothetical protein
LGDLTHAIAEIRPASTHADRRKSPFEFGSFGTQGIVVFAITRSQSDVVVKNQPGAFSLVGPQVGGDLGEHSQSLAISNRVRESWRMVWRNRAFLRDLSDVCRIQCPFEERSFRTTDRNNQLAILAAMKARQRDRSLSVDQAREICRVYFRKSCCPVRSHVGLSVDLYSKRKAPRPCGRGA